MPKTQPTTSPPLNDLLGPIEHLVMKAVSELPKNAAYGMEVFDAIRAVYRPISLGSVYSSLERLTWKGYLESRTGEPKPIRGGRAKQFFRATPLGKRVLEGTETVLAFPLRPNGARHNPPSTRRNKPPHPHF